MTLLFISLMLLAVTILSLCFCFLIIRNGPEDAPDGGRKEQSHAVATAGGLGVFAAVALVLSVYGLLHRSEATAAFWMSVAQGSLPHVILFFGAFGIGLWDDMIGMEAKVKLIIVAALCFFACGAGFHVQYLLVPGTQMYVDLNPVFAIAGSAAWLLVLINAVNFMDGSNGLAPGMMLIAFAGLAVLYLAGPWSGLSGAALIGVTCLMIVAGLAAFLFWNLKNMLYMGDTGALALGAAFGSLTLYGAQYAPLIPTGPIKGLVWLPAAFVLPILIDVLLTLAWRHRAQQDLLSPHREHAYQWLLRRGSRPIHVACLGWGLTALSAFSVLYLPPLIGKAGQAAQGQSVGIVFVALVAALTAAWSLQRKYLRPEPGA